MKRLKARAAIAAAKIEKIGSGNGTKVRLSQTTKYYDSMFLPVLTANMAMPQLDRSSGDLPGYILARQATANIIRRMLSTSDTTPPNELVAEVGWDLPDKEIIKSKLRLMDRLLVREHNLRADDEERKQAGDRQDAPSAVLRQRIRDVEGGDTKGLCAEVKRLWTEAGMAQKWPPPMSGDTISENNHNDIEEAAERISFQRLRKAIARRSQSNPDTPYDELWDGTTWRLSNGSRKQIGLMTSARTDALIMNDSKIMSGAGAPSECRCCGSCFDNFQHAVLKCKHEAMVSIRTTLKKNLKDTFNKNQAEEFRKQGDHDKKMTLLGKQMENKLGRTQQKRIDLAVKVALEKIDTFRTTKLLLNPMCGRTYTRPPEESLQQAALWDRMWREEILNPKNGDYHQDELINDHDEEDWNDQV